MRCILLLFFLELQLIFSSMILLQISAVPSQIFTFFGALLVPFLVCRSLSESSYTALRNMLNRQHIKSFVLF